MILVTGATGNVGRHLVSSLAREGVAVRALTRDPEAARSSLPTGVEPVRTDRLGEALEGAAAVFLNPAAFGNGADELLRTAREKGVRRVVLLSSSSVVGYDPHGPEGPNLIADTHTSLESQVEATGLEWTHLRPGAFAANALAWADQIRSGDTVRGWYADARTTPIHEADIADVAARALLTDELLSQAPLLSGPEALTFRDQTRLVGEALGRTVRYEEIPAEEVRDAMVASGMPADLADDLTRAFGGAVDVVAEVSPAVGRITGRPARTFRQWAEDRAADFR